ncbi:MAG: hypothetical protein E7673_04695 [Ruminococcaceae bacterium]|nr:hypothetical protein [Oscillospiraceae bacterium]
MKKLLALVLVMILALACMTSCEEMKDKVSGGFNNVKETVGGWFGIEFDDDKDDDKTPGTTPGDGNKPDDGTTTPPEEENYAEMAINYLDSLYGEADSTTAKSYELPAKYTVPGTDVVIDIVWTVNVDTITIAPAETEGLVTVTLPEAPETDISYTITATVTDAKGNTDTTSFDRVVPSVNNFMTIDEYYALNVRLEENKPVIIKGIVTGIISKANGWKYDQLHLQDESGRGGYYVYDIVDAPMDDIKVGMTVKVTGIKNVNYGVDRIEKSTVEILDTTIKTVTPVDYTDIYLNAESLTDATLNQYDGLLVTLKGVEITGQTLDQGYYHFLLGNKESYVRISSSTVCLTKAEVETFKANHTNNKGKLADVVGVITSFNNAFYLVPVSADAFSNFRDAERTPEDKLNYELGNIEVPTSVKKNSDVELTVAGGVYKDVVISWASNNAAAVVSEDGKTVTFTLGDEAVTVTLTATAKIGDVTVTKDFTVNVAAKPNYVVNKVTNPAIGTAYKLYLYHATKAQDMYLTGKFDATYNYNLGTTGDVAQAVDFYLEDAGNGMYYLSATVDKVKKYINLAVDGKYLDITIDMDPITSYKFDTEVNTLVSTQTTSEGTFDFYFGTYASNNKTGITTSKTSYITGGNAANVGVTQFVVYLVSITNLDDVTDADKVAMEKDKLDVNTKVSEDTEIDLPAATLEGVTVEWTAEGAEIKDGKLVIVLGKEAVTVTLTATIKAGEATDTKIFTIEVPAKSNKVLTPMYTFEEGVAYKIVGKNAAGFIYFDGTVTSGRINGVADIANSVDVFVKFVDKAAGTFYLYFMDGNTVKYIEGYAKDSNKTSAFRIVDTAPESTWSLNDQNALVSSGNGRAIATQDNSTYNNFSTYATSNLGTAPYFTSYLATLIEEDEVPEITDEDMVKAESELVKVDVTEVTNDFEFTLPTPIKYADKVTFTWTTDNACAVITDGKLVITLPKEDAKVTLTLVIACGDVKETKTFEISVVVPIFTMNKVTAPEAEKAYKLHLYQAKLGKDLFFNGKKSGDYFATTDQLALAADVYLEATEGGYYLYCLDAEGKKSYLDMYEYTTDKVGIRFSATPGCVYFFDAELGILLSNIKTAKYDNDYYLGTYNTYNTLSANSTYYITGNNAANLGVSQFVAYLVEINCKHEFTTDCDTTCDVCGATRETTVEHTYTDDCDATCDCGATREAPHKYTADCDTTCDCGATRKPLAEHVDEAEDGTCDVCGSSMADVENALIEAAKAEIKLNTEYTSSVQFILTEKVGRVAITWASQSNAVVINGNVVTVKLGAEAAEAVLVATFKCGATKITEEYKLALAKAPTLDIMEVIAPETGKAYKLYFYQENLKTGYFVIGKYATYYYKLDATTVPADGTDFYLEATEGGYYIKFGEKYLTIYSGYQTSSPYSEIQEFQFKSEPTTVFVYNAELGTFTANVDSYNWVIGSYNENPNVDLKKLDDKGIFYVKLVEAVCTHEFSSDCDATCNVCAYTRDVTGVEHTVYDNACDTTCACGFVREVADHVDATNDNLCDNCSIDMKALYAERVEAAKTENALAEKMNAGTAFTVKTVTGAYDSVTITWTSDTAIIATVDGVTTITMPNVSGDAVITATYTCGTHSETVTYKVALLKVGTVVSVDYLVGKPFYVYSDKWSTYMLGTIYKPSSTAKVMDSTTNINDATAFYIEKAFDAEGKEITGEYNLYFLDAEGVKNYIIMTGTSATKFDIVTTLEGALYPTWSFDAEIGTFYNAGVYAKSATNSAYLVGFYMSSKTHYDFRTAKKGFTATGTTDYAALIVVNCEHVYAGDCATACGICGEEREATGAHTYDGCDDTACNVCGATREAVAHIYGDGCEDTVCDVCGATREAVGKHAYSSECDATCNNEGCSYVRDDAKDCVDTDGDKICDYEGCGKEIGADTPTVPVEPEDGKEEEVLPDEGEGEGEKLPDEGITEAPDEGITEAPDDSTVVGGGIANGGGVVLPSTPNP